MLCAVPQGVMGIRLTAFRWVTAVSLPTGRNCQVQAGTPGGKEQKPLRWSTQAGGHSFPPSGPSALTHRPHRLEILRPEVRSWTKSIVSTRLDGFLGKISWPQTAG